MGDEREYHRDEGGMQRERECVMETLLYRKEEKILFF